MLFYKISSYIEVFFETDLVYFYAFPELKKKTRKK